MAYDAVVVLFLGYSVTSHTFSLLISTLVHKVSCPEHASVFKSLPPPTHQDSCPTHLYKY